MEDLEEIRRRRLSRFCKEQGGSPGAEAEEVTTAEEQLDGPSSSESMETSRSNDQVVPSASTDKQEDNQFMGNTIPIPSAPQLPASQAMVMAHGQYDFMRSATSSASGNTFFIINAQDLHDVLSKLQGAGTPKTAIVELQSTNTGPSHPSPQASSNSESPEREWTRGESKRPTQPTRLSKATIGTSVPELRPESPDVIEVPLSQFEPERRESSISVTSNVTAASVPEQATSNWATQARERARFALWGEGSSRSPEPGTHVSRSRSISPVWPAVDWGASRSRTRSATTSTATVSYHAIRSGSPEPTSSAGSRYESTESSRFRSAVPAAANTPRSRSRSLSPESPSVDWGASRSRTRSSTTSTATVSYHARRSGSPEPTSSAGSRYESTELSRFRSAVPAAANTPRSRSRSLSPELPAVDWGASRSRTSSSATSSTTVGFNARRSDLLEPTSSRSRYGTTESSRCRSAAPAAASTPRSRSRSLSPELPAVDWGASRSRTSSSATSTATVSYHARRSGLPEPSSSGLRYGTTESSRCRSAAPAAASTPRSQSRSSSPELPAVDWGACRNRTSSSATSTATAGFNARCSGLSEPTSSGFRYGTTESSRCRSAVPSTGAQTTRSRSPLTALNEGGTRASLSVRSSSAASASAPEPSCSGHSQSPPQRYLQWAAEQINSQGSGTQCNSRQPRTPSPDFHLELPSSPTPTSPQEPPKKKRGRPKGSKNKSKSGGSVCNICLDVKRDQDMVTPRCGHVYHQKCLQQWLKSRRNKPMENKCPVCKKDVEDVRVVYC